jgi:hypothetical protein
MTHSLLVGQGGRQKKERKEKEKVSEVDRGSMK